MTVSRLLARLLRSACLMVPLAAPIAQRVAAQQPQLPSIDRSALLRLADRVVRVEADRERGGLSVGTAVTVAAGVLVTNCHVTREASSVRIAARGRLWPAVAQFADEYLDVCLLRVPGWNGAAVDLGDVDTLDVGAAVAAVGFTGGVGISLYPGHVRAMHRLSGSRVIESDAPFSSGASGGGLFDGQGALLGILTFRAGADRFFATPVNFVRARLAALADQSQQWQEIVPLKGQVPFWQERIEQLPSFLRVGVFEAQERWEAVIDTCRSWVDDDPRSPEPYVSRGRSYRRLGYPLAAGEALRAALRHAPRSPTAWFELGLVYADQHEAGGIDKVEQMLQSLDASLAERLRQAVVQQTP